MKKEICIFMALLMLCSLSACFRYEDGGKELNIYFKNSFSNALSPEKTPYKGEDDANDMAQFVLTRLLEGPQAQGNLAVIPEGTKLNTVEIRGTTANVDFSREFLNAEGTDELLARFAVVSTLCDIPNIDGVLITVTGEPLVSRATGKEIGRLRKSDIVYDTTDDPQPTGTASVKLYFANSDATALKSESRRIETQNSLSIERTIIAELLKGPDSGDLIAVIPAETKLLNIETNNGVCFVNFSSDFVSKFSGGTTTGMLIVYSIVNSLCTLDDVDSVQILIEGKTGAEFGDFVFDEPIFENKNIIQKD